MSHTPGPWEMIWLFTAPDESQYDILAPRHDTTEYTHDIVCTMSSVSAEAEANARLIAAAPELLEALKEAWCWMPAGTRLTPAQRGAKCETLNDAHGMVNIAIAKAEGSAA